MRVSWETVAADGVHALQCLWFWGSCRGISISEGLSSAAGVVLGVLWPLMGGAVVRW